MNSRLVDDNRDMREVLKEIDHRFGLGKVSVVNLRVDNLILERSSDKATLSIIPSPEHGGYSAQIEVPDASVPFLGFDIPLIDDDLPYAKMLRIAGNFIESS